MESNEMNGLMFKMEDDPRIIGSGPDGKRHGLGWFIRRTSLDEFPQFLNVLKGDIESCGNAAAYRGRVDGVHAQTESKAVGKAGAYRYLAGQRPAAVLRTLTR